ADAAAPSPEPEASSSQTTLPPPDQLARAEGLRLMDDTNLEKLRYEHPTWCFEAKWFAAAAGPDKRLFVARREGVTLSAWVVTDLGAQVALAEQEMGR